MTSRRAALLALLLLALAGASRAAPPPVDLVDRRYARRAEDAPRLTEAQARGDLDELQRRLEAQHAYLGRTGVDHAALLDRMRAGCADGIAADDLAVQVAILLARLGDGHSRVRGSRLRAALPGGVLTLTLRDVEEGVAVLRPDGRLLAPDAPLLRSIDGVELDRWIGAARALAPDGAPPLARRVALQRAMHVGFVRQVLGRPDRPAVPLVLASADGARTIEVWRPLEAEAPRRERPPPASYRVLEAGALRLGVLRVPTFSVRLDPDHVETCRDAMERARAADGLIIDVRGNGGGRRDAIFAVLPPLLPPDVPAAAVNVAAYRTCPRFEQDHLAARFLFRRGHAGWSPAERAAAAAALDAFEPAWTPDGALSAWHAMVVPAGDAPRLEVPVVVLLDGGCFSATDIFLGALQGRPRVTLLGTPSAGGSGRARRVTLPASGIELQLSSMVSCRPDGRHYDGRGIEPDVVVRPRLDDLRGETDTPLEAAIALLRRAARPAP